MDPINIDFILFISKKLIKLLSNQETNEMQATASITPGIAYPQTENVVRKFKNLLFVTLFPKLDINANIINTLLASTTSKIVFKNNSIILRSAKCYGKIIVQYIICNTGNKKLIKNTVPQIKNAVNAL